MDEQAIAAMPPPEQLELRILSGLHAGAALPIGQEPVQLGSAEDCDVILLDPDILPHHLLLRREGTAWLAEPAAGAPLHDRRGAAVPGGAPLQPAHPLRAGRVWLVLCAASAPWQADELPDALPTPDKAPPAGDAPAPRRRRLWPLLLAGVPLLLVAFALACLAKPDRPAPPAPALPALAPGPADAETVGGEAARILRERGLQRVVEIVYETGHVALAGDLDDDEARRLDSAVAALHRRFGNTLVVDVKTTTLSRRLPFQVREVVTGVAPHITLADGTRVYEGGTVGGYRLRAILPGRLQFDGKRQLELPW